MMKVKTNTAKESQVVSEWLNRFGVNHTVKGFTLEFADLEQSEWNTVKSAIRLNTVYNVDHLEMN